MHDGFTGDSAELIDFHKMLSGLIFLAFSVGVTLAASSANQYVDNVIQSSLPNELRRLGLDPAPIANFNVKFGPQNVYQSLGEANFTFGNATGLKNLQRKSDCSGPRLFRGELTINCTLRLTQVLTAYKVRVGNGSQVYAPRNMGHVSETLLYVVISGRPQNYVGSVKSLQVTRIGSITPTFHGLPTSLNKYLKVLQDAYRANVSSQLFSILQDKYVSALGRALSYTPMPRQ